MSKSSYADYVTQDLLGHIDGVKARAMFGGYGVYKHGIIFGLIVDNTLYFKVGDSNKAQYEKYGSKPFMYHGHKGKSVAMSYWVLPEEIQDDPRLLEEWVEQSVYISLASKKPSKRTHTKKAGS